MSAQLRADYPAYPLAVLAVVCQTLDLPRSSVDARQHATAHAGDSELQAHIERIAGQWPTYGYRRMTAQLRREGVGAVNSKRVRQLMHDLGLAGHAPQRRCRMTNSDHPYPRYPTLVGDLAITQPASG